MRINNFGKGGHPEADENTLSHFQVPYVKECLEKLLATEGQATEMAKTQAKAALEALHISQH